MYIISYIIIPTLVHRKKKDREFPVPSRDVTTKLSLGGNNDVITELFLPRESLVSDIPAGDGKLVNLLLKVVGNEKRGGSGSRLLIEYGFGPWRSMSV